jgi:hypothetical protein
MPEADPQAWLTNVLTQIADHPAKRVADLTLWNFKNRSQQGRSGRTLTARVRASPDNALLYACAGDEC